MVGKKEASRSFPGEADSDEALARNTNQQIPRVNSICSGPTPRSAFYALVHELAEFAIKTRRVLPKGHMTDALVN